MGRYFAKTSQQHIKTRIVVAQGLVRFHKLKLHRPECSVQVALYNEKSHCTFANQYLASQHFDRLGLRLIWRQWEFLSEAYRHGLSETLRNWVRLYCTCIVCSTLEQCLVTLLLLFQDQKLACESQFKKTRSCKDRLSKEQTISLFKSQGLIAEHKWHGSRTREKNRSRIPKLKSACSHNLRGDTGKR